MADLEEVVKRVKKVRGETSKIGRDHNIIGSFVRMDRVSGVKDTLKNLIGYSRGFSGTAGAFDSLSPSAIYSLSDIWSSDSTADSIYEQYYADGSVIQSVSFTGPEPRGIGLDGSECIWVVDNQNASVYQIDNTASVISSFSSPSDAPYGLEIGGNGCVWLVESHFMKGTNYSSIYQLQQNGTAVSSIQGPGRGTAGVGLDANQSLWISNFRNDSVYQTNQDGSVISSFGTAFSPYGVGVAVSGSIWLSDYTNASLFEYDTSGTAISSISSPSNSPQGVGTSPGAASPP